MWGSDKWHRGYNFKHLKIGAKEWSWEKSFVMSHSWYNPTTSETNEGEAQKQAFDCGDAFRGTDGEAAVPEMSYT